MRCRIGLHTGPVLVGNLGSSRKMNYTILGDTVNLASRLEELSKRYGTKILISEDLYQAVQDVFLCRPIDVVAVKGRTHATRIYELMAYREQATAPQIRLAEGYGQALHLYLAREFAGAVAAVAALLQEFPADPPALRLLAQCQELQAHPPAAEWNGVTILHEK